MLKTQNCGELRPAHAGQEVLLAGWVHRRRDQGGLIFIDLEIAVVWAGHILMRLDVLFDDFIGYIPRAHGKIAPCPHMPPPILAFQLAKFLLQAPTAASFQPLHQLAHSHMGRNRHQQMDMVARNMSSENIDLHRRARLPDQFAGTHGNLIPQHRFTILRHPHHMVLQVVDRMRRFSVAHRPVEIQVSFDHRRHDNVRAGEPPLEHRSARPARPAVKTACLKAGVLDPIYRQ